MNRSRAEPSGTRGPVNQGVDGATAVEPEALVVSHWFDPGGEGEPYSATIRLTGRRIGIRGQPKPGDTFIQEDKVEGILPGSGPLSVTSWVYGLQPGEWTVTADLLGPVGHAAAQRADRWRHPAPRRLARAAWSWRRWGLSEGEAAAVSTRWAILAPLARMPAVIPGSFTLMGTLAIIGAFMVQAGFVAREGLPVGRSLVVSLLALAIGMIGAKLWYAVLHPGPWRQSVAGGWSVDGFLVVAPVVALAALLAFDLPIGTFLDASTPGIFIAVAIGRLGCFFTGCCAGRCTSSRWGVWSSDRRIGARRIPAQLLESGAGVIIGLLASALVVADIPGVHGLVFAAAIAAYIVVRQFLLRVRAERRQYSWRRTRIAAEG